MIMRHDLKLTKKDKLRACPFCGCNDAILEHTWTPSYWIACDTCGAQMHPVKNTNLAKNDLASHKKGKANAIEAWNNRP